MSTSIYLLLLVASAAGIGAAFPQYESHYSKHRLQQPVSPPQEYIEVVRPLPTDALTPSCTLPVLSHSFGNTYGLPPTNSTYSAPVNCTWSHAVLHLSGASNGSQYDRIGAVWLSAVEILRTSTPEPTPEGIFWNVRKDVTKYSSLLRKSNLTLAVMLENLVNDVYTAVYRVNLTLLYYNLTSPTASAAITSPTASAAITSPFSMPPPPNRKSSHANFEENPADLIIPISTSGDEGFWFKIQSQSDSVFHGIKLPLNTYRAVIEVYASSHGDDEFWYSNPPDSYFEINHLPKTRAHGASRQIQIKLDDNVVGIVIPFPVIFTGGINPLFWDPVVSIGAFDLPSYEIELTPFLSMLLDGNHHYIGFGVAESLPFWLMDANLHLWIDEHIDSVQAGAIKFNEPTNSIERESRFNQLDSRFEIEAESESHYLGWVNYSAGNITVNVKRKVKFENTIEFTKNGTQKKTEAEVKENVEFNLKYSDAGVQIRSSTVERKYPLKIKTIKESGSGEGTDMYLMRTNLKHSVEEKMKRDKYWKSNTVNSQKCNGWMVVEGHDVRSGGATTEQELRVKDNGGCYARQVTAAEGAVVVDRESFLCNGAVDDVAAVLSE